MSPRKPSKQPDNAFETGLNELENIVSNQPVAGEALLPSLSALENSGLNLIGSGELNVSHFAEVMHRVFSKVAEWEIVPPLSQEQLATMAGKVATYGAMREAAAPKTTTKSKPTDTEKVPTDKRKG